MVSMTVTLVLAFAAVNITLRVQVTRNTDAIIDILHENGGHFSVFRYSDESSDGDRLRGGGFMHSETPYETRYYVAYIGEDKTLIKGDFGHVALTNLDMIQSQVQTIAQSDKSRGYIDNYRYGRFEDDEGIMIIGIDCSSSLATVDVLMTITLVTIISVIAIVFILLMVLSNRVMRPFEENREKQQRFITDAGHELKTPIAIIRSNAEVIEMTEGGSKWLTNIMQQTERMSKLVKELIELSKADEQTVSEKEKQRIILSEITSDSVEIFSIPAQAKGIELTADIAPNVAVMGDLEDMVRVVGILLDNAIKYTDDRKLISVSLAARSKKAVLKISNTSRGLDRAAVPKFFDRFYRSDESRSSETGGHGIGLSMAQLIVRNHRGKIAVSYSDDEIITFSIELPLN